MRFPYFLNLLITMKVIGFRKRRLAHVASKSQSLLLTCIRSVLYRQLRSKENFKTKIFMVWIKIPIYDLPNATPITLTLSLGIFFLRNFLCSPKNFNVLFDFHENSLKNRNFHFFSFSNHTLWANDKNLSRRKTSISSIPKEEFLSQVILFFFEYLISISFSM